MGYVSNSGILFALSGVTLGKYTFEQNPESLTVIPPQQKFNVLKVLNSENIYQQNIIDNETRVMQWSVASRTLYANLKNYAARDINNIIPTSYLWDGTVKEMQGLPIQVVDVYGEPLQNRNDGWTIKLQFKPMGQIDKFYKFAIASGGSAGLTNIPLKVNVFNETYDIQIYDGSFNPLITGTNWKSYNSNTQELSLTISGLSTNQKSSACTILSMKNGWVVGKMTLSGILPGEYINLI